MPLTVATHCPTCAGALEFEEGTNAVRCPFCGSNHVVTGRGRVLSYFVPENMDSKQAVTAAGAALRAGGEHGWRPCEATLFFVPFYHYTAQVLRWEVQEVQVKAAEGATVFARPLGAVGADELLVVLSGGPGVAALAEKRFVLVGRHSDRSMPAFDAQGLGMYSLGIRPGVLKLSLFERGAVSARGLIAPVAFKAAEKDEIGFAPVEHKELFARAVFAKNRSLIYFPFWVVEVARPGAGQDGQEERALVAVDAVGGAVTSRKAGMGLLEHLVAGGTQEFERVGFRPLKCPDCANDLPVRPRDAIFFCGNCKKAWLLTGAEFTQVPYTVVRPAPGKKGTPDYLPFWVVKARMSAGERVIDNKFDLVQLAPGLTWPKEEDRQVPFRFFMPAFRMGNLKALSRLAAAFTRFQPVFEEDGPQTFNVAGSYLSPEDALTVAPLVLFSLIPKGNRNAVKFALEARVEPIEAELALVPFYKGRFELTDGLFGHSVPIAALKD